MCLELFAPGKGLCIKTLFRLGSPAQNITNCVVSIIDVVIILAAAFLAYYVIKTGVNSAAY